MGHITNPIGFRAGRVTNWSSLWSSDKYAYSNNWIVDLSFQRYFEFLFSKLQILSYKKGFIFSHADVFLTSNTYYIMAYIYNSNIMLLHKGRFYYFWTRLLKIKAFFLYRLQALYLKSEFDFLKNNSLNFLDLHRQAVGLQRNHLSLKLVAGKKPFSIVNRLFITAGQYKKGFLAKTVASPFLNKAFIVTKRYRMFKLYTKNAKKVKVIF